MVGIIIIVTDIRIVPFILLIAFGIILILGLLVLLIAIRSNSLSHYFKFRKHRKIIN